MEKYHERIAIVRAYSDPGYELCSRRGEDGCQSRAGRGTVDVPRVARYFAGGAPRRARTQRPPTFAARDRTATGRPKARNGSSTTGRPPSAHGRSMSSGGMIMPASACPRPAACSIGTASVLSRSASHRDWGWLRTSSTRPPSTKSARPSSAWRSTVTGITPRAFWNGKCTTRASSPTSRPPSRPAMTVS